MQTEDAGHARYGIWFTAALVVVSAFRAWFMTTLPLSGDESYHWEWSRHLAFGYYDHPALTAYLIRLSTLVFGQSTEFTVRLPALILTAGTAIVCFFLASGVTRFRGGGEAEAARAGLIAGLTIIVVPIFAFFAGYISTDPPLILFWSLSMLAFFRAFTKETWSSWIGGGLALGLAVMSKFLAFFLGVALLAFVLISPYDRKWLKKPHPYVAAACAFALLVPFLWWNATHGWATFMFNFVYRQQGGFHPRHMPEFLLGQMLALSPGIFVLCILAIGLISRAWIGSKDRAALFLGVTTVIPLAYFFYESFSQQVGLHWPTAAWIGALVQIACPWSLAISHGARQLIRLCHILSLGLALAITAIMYPLVHIPQSWMSFRWAYKHQPERISTDKLAERFGWRELGQWVSDVRREMLDAQKNRLTGSGTGGVFVLTGQYGLSSNVAFYTPEQIRTHLWRSKKTCGENYRFWDDFRSFKGMDSIYVAKEQRRAEQAMASLRQHFRKVQEPERLPIIVDGQEVRAFFLVRSYEYNGEIPEFD